MIEIYTDGAYNPALQRGGWGVVIIRDGQKTALSGAVDKTTGNRMEITAALEGILHTSAGSEITVYTDSQYVFGCMTQGWKRQANRDLWDKLDAAVSERKVQWKWMEGANGNVFHREAHELANRQIGQAGGTTAPEAKELSHIDARGRPRMVDVSAKPDTERSAVARGQVKMQPATLGLIKRGGMLKGDVLGVAQLAGIMAAKKTAELIPLCHPLLLGNVNIEFNMDDDESAVNIEAEARGLGKTGVEMEALTAVAVAALTIYDMCKAVDRGIRITDIRLVRKAGGKSGLIELES